VLVCVEALPMPARTQDADRARSPSSLWQPQCRRALTRSTADPPAASSPPAGTGPALSTWRATHSRALLTCLPPLPPRCWPTPGGQVRHGRPAARTGRAAKHARRDRRHAAVHPERRGRARALHSTNQTTPSEPKTQNMLGQCSGSTMCGDSTRGARGPRLGAPQQEPDDAQRAEHVEHAGPVQQLDHVRRQSQAQDGAGVHAAVHERQRPRPLAHRHPPGAGGAHGSTLKGVKTCVVCGGAPLDGCAGARQPQDPNYAHPHSVILLCMREPARSGDQASTSG